MFAKIINKVSGCVNFDVFGFWLGPKTIISWRW